MTPNRTQPCPAEQKLLDYVKDQVGPSERFQVEDHLLDCPLCAATVQALETYGVPPQGILAELTKHELKTVDALAGETANNKQELQPVAANTTRLKPYFRPRRALLAAAGAALILVVTYFFYKSQADEQMLFSQYFSPQPQYGYVSVRAIGVNAKEELLLAALTAHGEADFDLSIASWSAYLETEVDDLDYRPHLYLAAAQMELGQLKEAAENLAQLPSEADGPFIEEINWYRALLYLRKSEPSHAIPLLKKIAEEGKSVYREAAITLVAALEK